LSSNQQVFLTGYHPTQQKANDASNRFNLYMAGRRWGKDIMLMRRAAERIAKGKAQGWYSPTYRMMTDNFKELKNMLAPAITSASASNHRLEFGNGAVIDFWSLDNFDASRGRKYQWVTINEAAIAPNLLEAWGYVIRPTLADLQGGADFGTTPKGLNGFYTLWSQAEGKPEWTRHHFTTYDNPFIPKSEIEAMRDTLPERVYKQEILAEFVEDGAYFQNVDAVCTIEAFDEPKNHEGHRLVAGLDWALSEDFTVLTIICGTCGKTVEWYRINRLDYTMQRLEIAERLRRWNAVVMPERNSIGQPNIEMLVQMGLQVMTGPDGGLGFNTTAGTKAELIQKLAAGISRQEIHFPKEYADELRSFEVTTTLSGNPKFSAPEGLHDDRVISAALAWWAASTASWYML
jgi:hypothetical protein